MKKKPRAARLNLRLEKDLHAWIVRAARMARASSASDYARRILFDAYDKRNSDKKRAAK
jgi:uncharacterized protein (DUF1778 family)